MKADIFLVALMPMKSDVERRYETSLIGIEYCRYLCFLIYIYIYRYLHKCMLNSKTIYINPKEKVGQCTPIRTRVFSISAPSTHDLRDGDWDRSYYGQCLKFNRLYISFLTF